MPKMEKLFVVKLLLLPLLFLSLVFLRGGKALAAPEDINICEPYDASWKLIPWLPIDIQNTVENLLTAVANSGFAKVFGRSTNEVIACESTVISLGRLSQAGLAQASCTQLGFSPACPALIDSGTVCAEMMNTTKTAYMYKGKPANLLAVDSSLVGISNRIQNTVLRDPIAVNLAYYFKSQVAKIPFVGKTYAATLDSNDMAIIHAGLKVWQACRDVALGFMAVILMYTGLMIVMRKKVNPQLVVTVQYAIPKIIIGLILILFSYPIGAAITGLSWALFRSSTEIVVTALYGAQNVSTFANQVLLGLAIGTLKMGYFGGIGFILIILVVVATLIMMIVVYLKALLIYIKMVFSTIISPFELALGTVPGSEDRIKDWFLRMAKYGITIFAMGLVIPATLSIAFEVLMYYSCSCTATAGCDVTIETTGLGSFLMVVAPLVIVIIGFSLAFKMESAVDETIFGGKSKGKKR